MESLHLNERIEKLLEKKISDCESLEFLTLEDIRTIEIVSKVLDHCLTRRKNTKSNSVYSKQSIEELEKEFG